MTLVGEQPIDSIGKVNRALYRLQGEILTVCYSLIDDTLPDEIKPGKGVGVEVWRRKKP